MNATNFGTYFIVLGINVLANREGAEASIDGYELAVVFFLLFGWGLSGDDIGIAKGGVASVLKPETGGEVVMRLIEFVNRDSVRKAHLIRDLSTLLHLQQTTQTNAQREFITGLQIMLDMRPSEFELAFESGKVYAESIRSMCEEYIKRQKKLGCL